MLKKIGGAVVAFAPLAALAEVPAEVTTAIGGIKTDATSVAAIMVGVVAAVLVFKYIRQQLH